MFMKHFPGVSLFSLFDSWCFYRKMLFLTKFVNSTCCREWTRETFPAKCIYTHHANREKKKTERNKMETSIENYICFKINSIKETDKKSFSALKVSKNKLWELRVKRESRFSHKSKHLRSRFHFLDSLKTFEANFEPLT